MKIDVRSPHGNVFCILGAFQKLTKELEQAGCECAANRTLLKHAHNMKYDEILDKIEELTHGTITFTNRD